MRFRAMITIILSLIFLNSSSSGFGQTGEASFPEHRFVISELKPTIDPQMTRLPLVYMCAEPRVHQMELEPSPKGGFTKTRIAVRPTQKGSVYLHLDDQEPGYRMYQVFTRGFIVRALAWAGAEHVFHGSVSFGGYHFHSDSLFPLHFKYVPEVGYVHLCGQGTVQIPNGTVHHLSLKKNIQQLVSDLSNGDQLTRESASTALGYLHTTDEQQEKVVTALLTALKDPAMEVRRDAAESLGRIGNPRAKDGLTAALKDEDDWVREVSAHAISQITMHP